MLDNARVARLAMLDEGDLPRVLPVTFALIGETIWSAIDSKPKRSSTPARVARLRRRPEAALVVDHYEEEWGALAWVEVVGRVEVAEVTGEGDSLDALQVKYPQYRDQPPAGPLLGLHVERVVCWRAADFG
ncbi:hypothetical protein BH10ACT11_BH10ACT11_12460 [soil metagenome]